MPVARASRYEIDDTKQFDANLEEFFDALAADDPCLAEVLKRELPKRLRGEIERDALWDALYASTAEAEA